MSAVPHPLESPWLRIWRWAIAALVVCALHVGILVLALMQPSDDTWDDLAGGVNVDMVAPPAPTPVKSDEAAALGPETDQGREVAEEAKRLVQKVEKDEPIVEPSPAPNPEIALPRPRPEEKEQPKEEAREATEKKVAQEEGEDVVMRAPPPVEAPPPSAAAKSEGMSAVIARAKAGWMQGLVRELERNKRIPNAARKNRGEWKMIVVFTVDRGGKVLSCEIREGSGLAVLDQEAFDLLKRATFPPAPDELPGDTFEYRVPLLFKVS